MKEFIAALLSIWIAGKLGRNTGTEDGFEKASHALRVSIIIVCASASTVLGIREIVQSGTIPQVHTILAMIMLCTIILMGKEFEILGNVIIDSSLLSTGITVTVYVAVIGIMPFFSWLTYSRICLLLIASLLFSVVVRGAMWIMEDE